MDAEDGRARGEQGWIGRIRAGVEQARLRAEEVRARVASVDAAFVASARDRRVAGGLLACALAYRVFLWLLPLSLVIVALAGFVASADPQLPADVADDLGLSAYVASTVRDASQSAQGESWLLLVFGLVGLLWAGRSGADALRTVHALAWGLPRARSPRPIAGSLAFTGVALTTLFVSLMGTYARESSAGLGLFARLSVVFVYAGAWLAVSSVLPRASAAGWRDLLPGAILVAVGGQVLHLVTVFYLVDHLARSSELYGSLGSAAAILLALYLLGRLIVGSAVLNATLWDRHHPATAARGRSAVAHDAPEAEV